MRAHRQLNTQDKSPKKKRKNLLYFLNHNLDEGKSSTMALLIATVPLSTTLVSNTT